MKRLIICLLVIGFCIKIQAQTIPNPPQTDEIIIDNGSSGKADPNDRIRYKVSIQNTAGPDGTGTQLNIVPDPRTTFVAGSFRSSPLALNDAYACTGNVGINIPAASGLKANDFDDNIAAALVSAGTFATAQGGSIVIAADGGFQYTPPAGFTGSDTYSYTLNDGNPVGLPVPLTDMATVTFTVSNLIWFIDNSAAAGDGRRNTPFNTLTAFNAVSTAAGDVIYIEHTGTNYTGGIVLQNNERLFGEGHTGAANLSGVLPFTLAPNSFALPNINGTRPVIENSGGDGILLASGNTIRGLNIGNCSDFGIDDNGNAGTLTISELNINTTGGGFRTDGGGTLAVSLGSLTSSGGINGINLVSTNGSFSVTGATNVTNTTGVGISIGSTSSGAVTFNSVTVGGSGSHGIELLNNIGTITVTGTTTINSPVAGANISLHIAGGTGAVTFAGLDINGRRDKGIRIAGGTRNITTGALVIDNSNSITAQSLDITATTGGTISFGTTTINNNGAISTAVEIQNNTAVISFASGSSISNNGGINFYSNQGSGNITYNGTINNTGGVAVLVQARTGGTVSFTGNITHNTTAIGININNNSGGSIINFSGTSNSLTSSSQHAISLVSNTGATINFTGGGLAITTTTGTGFNATGGGTITVQGTGNTINSTSGATALNVVNTTIGGSNLNFQSISSNGGASTGIILDNTGASGGLIVNGDGSNTSVGGNSTGGTITGKTGANGQTTTGIGIYLNNTRNVVLRRMTLNGTKENFGFRGISVTNFTLEYSTVTGTNGNDAGLDEGSINFDNLLGSAAITSCNIDGGLEDNLNVVNTTGTLNRLTISSSIFGFNSTASGNNNILLEALSGGATLNFTIQSSTIKGARADWINASCGEGASMDAIIGGAGALMNSFDNLGGNAHPGAAAGGNRIVLGATGTMTFDINSNTTKGSKGEAIRVRSTGTAGGATGTATGQIRNNVIGVAGTANSGSSEGSGIFLFGDGGSDMTASVTNNQVYQYNNHGIRLDFGDEINDGSTFHATVTGNTVNTPGNINSEFNGFHLNNGTVGATDNFTTCLHLSGNNLVGSGNGVTSPNNQQFRLRQRQSTTVRLPGYGGANNNDAGVVTFIQGQNTVTGGNGAASNTVPTGGGFIGGAACPTN